MSALVQASIAALERFPGYEDWQRARQCRQKHDVCPHNGRHARGKNLQRLDIQGLRAIAVVVVVLNHLGDWPKGGFVGVDVFFVISGYLITGRLLRTATTKSVGRYFGSFYVLRARRILPAGLLVIALTVIASWLTYGTDRAHHIATDGGWAAIFWANWHFSALNTDYFAAGNGISPLQHYWSLSVEEQFYLGWPLLVLLACWVVAAVSRKAGITPKGRDLTVGGLAVVLSGTAFAYSLHHTQHSPTGAYFSTFDRAWELGAGAALACFLPHLPRLARSVAEVASWLGVAVIGVAVFVTPASHGFPGPWAALAVGGSALVIAAGGLSRKPVANFALTNPVSTFVGDISYSVYLTHFPLVVILGALMPGDAGYRWAAVLAATLGLSVLSYYLVEEPARTGAKRFNVNLGEKVVLGVSALCVALLAYTLQPIPSAFSAEQQQLVDQAAAKLENGPQKATQAQTRALQTEIVDALQSSAWPSDLSPSMGEAPDADRISSFFPESCKSVSEKLIPSDCNFGDAQATHTAVIIGDSITMSLATLFYDLAANADESVAGWEFTDLGTSGCSFSADLDQVRAFSEADLAGCRDRVSTALNFIDTRQPDLVLMTQDSTKDKDGSVATATLKQLAEGGSRVVYVMAPPPTGNPAECYTSVGAPSDCAASVPDDWKQYLDLMESNLASVGGDVLDTSPLYCVADQCPAFVGTSPTRADGLHPVDTYITKIAPAFGELITKNKLLSVK